MLRSHDPYRLQDCAVTWSMGGISCSVAHRGSADGEAAYVRRFGQLTEELAVIFWSPPLFGSMRSSALPAQCSRATTSIQSGR